MVAATTGVRRKRGRYGPEVMPLAYESYGRLQAESAQLLQNLATATAAAARAAGRETGLGLYARWRLELERVLLREQADIALLALGRRAYDVIHGNAMATDPAAPS